jgi:archaemetzincin
MNPIQLLQIGNAGSELVAALRYPIANIFRQPVIRTRANPDLEPFYDSARGQYNSTSILLHLKSKYPAEAPLLPQRGPKTKTLAVISADLFIPVLTYVFGEAELHGTVAIVSYFRLRNELYGLPANDALFRERFLKESLHELGHLYGLVHCFDQQCAMHASTYVEDIDLKGDSFCDRCLDVVRG